MHNITRLLRKKTLKCSNKVDLQGVRVLLQLLVNLGHSSRQRCPLHAVCAAEQKLKPLGLMRVGDPESLIPQRNLCLIREWC